MNSRIIPLMSSRPGAPEGRVCDQTYELLNEDIRRLFDPGNREAICVLWGLR